MDLAFLCMCITSNIPGRPAITDDEFYNVPIITAYNTHKDSINTLGSHRFAAEPSQVLTHFFSDDKVASQGSEKKKGRKTASNRKLLRMPDDIQRLLWDAPHSTVSDLVLPPARLRAEIWLSKP